MRLFRQNLLALGLVGALAQPAFAGVRCMTAIDSRGKLEVTSEIVGDGQPASGLIWTPEFIRHGGGMDESALVLNYAAAKVSPFAADSFRSARFQFALPRGKGAQREPASVSFRFGPARPVAFELFNTGTPTGPGLPDRLYYAVEFFPPHTPETAVLLGALQTYGGWFTVEIKDRAGNPLGHAIFQASPPKERGPSLLDAVDRTQAFALRVLNEPDLAVKPDAMDCVQTALEATARRDGATAYYGVRSPRSLAPSLVGCGLSKCF